jgi:hypothetical protein
MRVITVDKKELLLKLEANREEHEREYRAAHAAWNQALIAKLREMLAQAEAGKGIELCIDLPEPQSHTDDYEIDMLKWHGDDTVELSAIEFQHYVQDQWNWKRDFLANASQYVSGN